MNLNLTSKDIIGLNKKIVALTGEPHQLIKSYLDSALHSSEYYDNYFDKVASIIRSLVMNHNFQQGNKRTAAIVLAVLLPQIDFDDNFLTKLILEIVKDKLDVSQISKQIVSYAKDNITENIVKDYITKHKLTLEILYNL